jgi:hypothetical protein
MPIYALRLILFHQYLNFFFSSLIIKIDYWIMITICLIDQQDGYYIDVVLLFGILPLGTAEIICLWLKTVLNFGFSKSIFHNSSIHSTIIRSINCFLIIHSILIYCLIFFSGHIFDFISHLVC